MPELGSSGSVRGVLGNEHPYRDPRSRADPRPSGIKPQILSTSVSAAFANVSVFEWLLRSRQTLAFCIP